MKIEAINAKTGMLVQPNIGRRGGLQNPKGRRFQEIVKIKEGEVWCKPYVHFSLKDGSEHVNDAKAKIVVKFKKH